MRRHRNSGKMGKMFTDAEVVEILRDYVGGELQADLSRKYGVAAYTICYWVKKAGVGRSFRHKWEKIREEVIKK